MDIGEKDKYDLEKRNENNINYQAPVMSSDWQFGGASLTNGATSLVPCDNPLAIGSSCATALVVHSFGSNLWEHSSNSQNLGFCDINMQNGASSSNAMGIGKDNATSLRCGIDRPFDMGWNTAGSMLKGGIFLPNVTGILPQSLSQLPADSAFIERAARFSSFNGGNFSDMVNPFGVPESMGLYARGVGLMQGPEDIFATSGMKSVSGVVPQKTKLNVTGASTDACLQVENRAKESPPKNERNSESLVRPNEEAKQGTGGCGNESNEAEFSGGGDQDEPSALDGARDEPSAKGLSSKKRKRSVQDAEVDQAKGGQPPIEAAQDTAENQQKGDQKQTTMINKTMGKQVSPAHPPKEEYIHVRARRGQATNSHSLAERVRREKISERMKFLQDLVPGCSKVTGKAVMLDEIINYVQSLQQQVEFLSMKLATVNPRLDFNVEGLLAKDTIQLRAGPSSTLGFSPHVSVGYPALHPSQPGLVQAALPVMGNNADVIRRTLNSQFTSMAGGFKEPNQQSNPWEDELHNVVQMNYGNTAPSDSQDGNGPLPSVHMKAEL